MSTALNDTVGFPDDPEEATREVTNAIAGSKTTDKARTVYDQLLRAWGIPETYVDDGARGVPVTRFARKLWQSHEEAGFADETRAETLYGVRHPFLAGALASFGDGDVRDAESVADHTRDIGDSPDRTRALVDNSVVKSASPVIVDPEIFSILRQNAPILDIIPTVSQAGFTAQYNVFDQRTLEDFFLTEQDAADMTDNTASDFRLGTDTRDMKIMATLIDVGDFSQRAEESLDYMDLMDTTLGQVMQEWFIASAKAYIYGDKDTTTGSGPHEDSNGFDGLAAIADEAGNVNDKTAVSSGRLEDLLDFVTERTQDSRLTFGNARYLVSPAFYNTIYDEVTPVVRLDGYDADVEFGPQGLAIGHERGSVPITPVDGIRDLQSESDGVGSNSTDGDVFLYRERAVQFRALMPDSTIPLDRIGLADRAALAKYGTLIDKTFTTDNTTDADTHRLRYGDV